MADEIASLHAPGIYEIRPLLADRLERLKQIMEYLKQNNLRERVSPLGTQVRFQRPPRQKPLAPLADAQLSQTARRILSRDAEKAKVAIDLWEHQDRLLR